MEWLMRKITGNPTTNSQDHTSPALAEDTQNNGCIACDSPCNIHEALPEHLANKINQTKELYGTVKPYQKHIFVCGGHFSGFNTWEPKVEKEKGSLIAALSEELKAKSANIPFKVLITLSEQKSEGASSNAEADFLVFPEMMRYHLVKIEDIPSFVEEVIIQKKQELSSIKATKLDKVAYVYVCGHKKRDKRCGVAGPQLSNQFQISLKEKHLEEKVEVALCSHTGGHKFAGNIIIYPGGTWYGRVTACHVDPLIQKHIVEGKIIQKIWRGTIGAPNQPSSQSTDESSAQNQKKVVEF